MPLGEARRAVEKYGVSSDFILYVGSINSRKNLMSVIRVLALLEPSERLPLVVIGGGSGGYRQRCMDEAERLDVSKHIHIIEGLSSMRTLQAFYTMARCLVYPSFYEGFGLPVAEAILSCCPVVTSSVSSLPEAGGSAALYVDPNDLEAIKGAVVSLLGMSESQREEMTQKGRAEALVRFDPDALTAQVEKLYQQVLGQWGE